ncbi:septation protein SepH [Nesterenkonia populi]|uniref:septation protein SepH n=1 Tax=Nesterenkonia populi TaxID=1591087 RepID=UPI0011BEB1AC|nr:septation protein SepH [Nesterenkonia populi]
MQQLRILGVESQQHPPVLLLSDEDGTEYRLEIDEALRTAVGEATPHRAPRSEESVTFGPREIQARLRAGASVEQVVEASGHGREYVLRFAGPVADERAFHASRARETIIARASTAENHRLAFGDAPATLEAMVKVRLRAVNVALHSVIWDAWRREDGLWAVTCDFDLEASSAHAETIGERPPAEWSYDPASRTVRAQNRWAETLSALPQGPGQKRAGRRLAAVEEPFDVDSASAAAPRSEAAAPAQQDADGTDAEDLLDILRARRGQRLGTDEDGDDKLASLITRDEDPAGPARLRPVDDADTDEQITETLPGIDEIQRHGAELAEQDEPEPAGSDEEAPTGDDVDDWGFSYSDDQETTPIERPKPEADADEEDGQKKSRRKARRPSMPSWDDILFGSKNE